MSRLALLVLVVFAVVFALWLRGATTLFAVEVGSGRVLHRKGRLPPSLLGELEDVFRDSRVRGTITAVSDQGAARVVTRGDFDDGLVQQVRNVVGRYPLARIRAGARARRTPR